MYVPSPNEQDFLLWAAQRIDAGDVTDVDEFGDLSIGVAPWTHQCLFDGIAVYGDHSDLQYEDIVLQMVVRNGVEARPWAEAKAEKESESWGFHEADEDGDLDDYYDYYDYGDYRDEEAREVTRIILPITQSYRPSTEPGNAVLIDGIAYVVWGDWLWEACEDGELREVVELTAASELYCAIDHVLVLTCGHDVLLFDVVAREFVRRGVDVPVFSEEARPEACMLSSAAQSPWVDLPLCVEPRILDISPCARFVRIKDRLGKGGILEVGTWRLVGDAGGPYRHRPPSRHGPKLGGKPMRTSDWRELVQRIERDALRKGGSAFSWHDGRARYTDNGLTFFENERLILVLDRPMHRVSFSPDGRFVLASTHDTLVRIDLDAQAIVDTWSPPARLRYLRSVLPRYQPDEYVEQIVALWEVLADPNARSRTVPVSIDVGVSSVRQQVLRSKTSGEALRASTRTRSRTREDV